MDGSAFWMHQCPERGLLLTHMHSSVCRDDHDENTCCHCGKMPEYGYATFAPMPPVDIERRLNGKPGPDEAPLRATHENKYARGVLPGPEIDLGRGPLTVGQMYYLDMVRSMMSSRGH